MQPIELTPLMSITTGFLVLFVGKRLNLELPFLRQYSIPEPVSGGLLVAVLLTLLHSFGGPEVVFQLDSRDFLLVYFFTTVGINARFADLIRGGPALFILLGLTIGFMTIQNLIGVGMSSLLGLHPATGLLVGTVSLIGGHGTTIAWAQTFQDQFQIENAMEVGIAAATFGLVLASASGGPIAQFLINRFNVRCPEPAGSQDAEDGGQSQSKEQVQEITAIDVSSILTALLAINICILTGKLLNSGIAAAGLKLPLFVPCLLVGILFSNLLPDRHSERVVFHWPKRSAALNLIGELSLGIFLAMSLMSLQLWNLVGLALPLLVILVVQFLFALVVNILLVFPSMGRNYDATVICAGFGGISLGSTPTAMANMTAVTQQYGPSTRAFLIVPLVSAFFLDLVNAVLIPAFIGWL
jgi:ESS family glutamate:Na+ symporter